MTKVATLTSVSVIPCLRYHDAPAAIDWLCETFGFERRLVIPGEGGAVAHAELSLGNGMVMLGSAKPGDPSKPAESAAGSPQGIYVVVPDADALCRRAKEAGATIVLDVRDTEYGSREFSCLDLEGYSWGFGTYDPCRDS